MSYYPKKSDIQVFFNAINKVVFKGILPQFDDIVKQTHLGDAYAYVQTINDEDHTSTLYIKKSYPRKDMFFCILAHQMVHLWQAKVKKQRMNATHHGASFYSWEQRFQRFGLPLSQFVQSDYDTDIQDAMQLILGLAEKSR